MPVWEVVEIEVARGREEEFESTARSLVPLLSKAEGIMDINLLRGIDREGAFTLLIEWQSVEHHTEVFTKSEAWATSTEALTPFFTGPPTAFHAIKVIDGI
jgi:heme-degrading monooxygenase HmoA